MEDRASSTLRRVPTRVHDPVFLQKQASKINNFFDALGEHKDFTHEMENERKSIMDKVAAALKKGAKVCEICTDELTEDIINLKTCKCEFHMDCLKPYF